MHPDNVGKQFRGLRREVRNGEALLPMTSGAPKKHNITWHNDDSHSDEHLTRIDAAWETQPTHADHWDMPASIQLHTTQSHFGSQGIRRFMKNPSAPSMTAEGQEAHEDLPEVYHHQGKYWIYEGHHRILSSRLSGAPSITVHFWDTRR